MMSGHQQVPTPFTPREHDIMRLLRKRVSAADMAEELGISVNTIKFHRKNIYAKCGVHRLVDAIATYNRDHASAH